MLMKNNEMKWHRWAIAAAVIGSQSNNHLVAEDTPDTINNLKQQIEQLDQQVRTLERNRELEKEASEAKAKEAPKISIGEKGFSFGSADGNFVIRLKGVLQTDSRTFFKERALATELVPNRDIGVELHGDLFGGCVSYAAGIFNGIGNARNSGNADFEDDKDFEGRIMLPPLKTSNLAALQGLGFGVGG